MTVEPIPRPDTPDGLQQRARWVVGAQWVLAIGVAATMLGTTAAVYRGDGSSINAFLFLDVGMSHEAAGQTERTVLGVVTAAACMAIFWPRWFLLVPVAAYMLAEAVAGYYVRGYAFSELTPAAHSLRYLTPLALLLLAVQRTERGGLAESAEPEAERAEVSFTLATARWLLRAGVAVVFFAHGYEALRLHPEFIDLVISSGQNVLDLRIEQATASTALRAIGLLDMAVALLVLVRPWPVVLVWMAAWGLVTAVSRMTSYGWGAYTDVLMRATHFAAPLALLMLRPVQSVSLRAAGVRRDETAPDDFPTAG